MLYAFHENFVLPLSHDEVVHGKGSLLGQDAGRRVAEVRQPAAALRLHVGASGQEAAVHGRRVRPVARVEPRRSLDWHLLDDPRTGVQRWVRDLNRSTAPSRRCTSSTSSPAGFEWIDCNDNENSVRRNVARHRARGLRRL
jgi:1,4-alpha-glucan branching enzyme